MRLGVGVRRLRLRAGPMRRGAGRVRRDAGRVRLGAGRLGCRLALVLSGVALPGVPGEVAGAQELFPVVHSQLFTNVTVIDGRGGEPRPSSAVLVWGGRIQEVGAQSSIIVPEGADVIDLAGAWIVPGFIDVHASPRTADDLRALLAAGITGVREGSMPGDLFRERGREGFGDDPVPHLYVGGPVLDAGPGAEGVRLESEADAIRAVQWQADDGAGFVSVSSRVPGDWLVPITRAARRAGVPLWADRAGGWLLALRAGAAVASPLLSGDPDLLPAADGDAAALPTNDSGGPRASDDGGAAAGAASTGEREAIAEAAAGGREAVVGASAGEREAATGASAGERARRLLAWLERLQPGGREVDRAVTALLASDASLVPLLASARATLERGSAPVPEEAWAKAHALLATLREGGIRLLVGSDAPRATELGDGFHREMELLVAAGIQPLEVIGMATRNAAIALGQLHERGTIEVGKRADLLILDGNPVADIRNARRVRMVILGGRVWSRDPDGTWTRVRFN